MVVWFGWGEAMNGCLVWLRGGYERLFGLVERRS